ncbi:MAG: thiamine phosphate synthase [Labilithrix sp.]|nr:thiamine phosphate synthase [Labilithrix sp.]
MTAPSVFLVTDPRWSLERIEAVIEAAGRALAPGALGVQLRDKSAPLADLARTARALRAVTARVGARFVVNAPTSEALEVAAAAGADGAHVPCRPDRVAEARGRLGAAAWISTPAHSDEDVSIAAAAGATGVLVSPIFASPGKGPPRGVAALTAARARAPDLVVIALGGVDASSAAACAAAGADGVAIVRALLDAGDPTAMARALDAPFRDRGAPAAPL